METITIKGEVFKKIKGFDKYYVSSTGDVFSTRTNIILSKCYSKRNPGKSGANYKLYNNDGDIKTVGLIKCIALGWVENSNESLYKMAILKNGKDAGVNHLNIIWATASISVCRKLKRMPQLLDKFKETRVDFNTRKMTDTLEYELVKMKEIGYSIKQLADIFPINKSQIFNILRKHKSTLIVRE